MAENRRNRWNEQDDRSNEQRGDYRRREGGARGNAYRINQEDDRSRRYGRNSEMANPEWQQDYFNEDRQQDRQQDYGGYGGYAHPHGYGYGAAAGGYYGGDSERGGYYGGSGSYGRDRGDHRGDYGGGRSNDRGMIDRASDEVASWFGDDGADRRRQQDKRGRGPKDYKRSDERILEDVCDRLSDDPMVDASEVNVQVAEREVTLEGTVPSREERRRAEDCAESVSGVQHVQNNIRVKQHGDQQTNPLA